MPYLLGSLAQSWAMPSCVHEKSPSRAHITILEKSFVHSVVFIETITCLLQTTQAYLTKS